MHRNKQELVRNDLIICNQKENEKKRVAQLKKKTIFIKMIFIYFILKPDIEYMIYIPLFFTIALNHFLFL